MKSAVSAVLIAAGGAMSGLEQAQAQDPAPSSKTSMATPVEPGGGASSSSASSSSAAAAPEQGFVPDATHEFNIPAGSLTDALLAYQATTGVQVEVMISSEKLAGVHSQGLHGSYSNENALSLILDQTGLSSVITPEGRVRIDLRNSERVEVTTSVASVALQQFTESAENTGQTITTIPQYLLQEQGATTLRDGLRNVPGISMAAGEGGSQGDTLTIRGFNARNDIYLDGIRDFGSYYRDAFDYESIDVLQGPAGVEFGRGSTGGVVNQETKEPRLRPFIQGNAQFGTDEMRRISADVDEPLSELSKNAAFRANIVATQSGVAERDIAQTRRFGIAPSLIFGLNTPTRFVVQYLHESENSTPDYGLPYFGNRVADVDRTTYYGFALDNYLRTNPDVFTGKVEHDIGVHATVRNVFRFANYPRDVRITEPQVNTVATVAAPAIVGAPITATCAIAATAASSCYALDTPLSQVTVKRNQLTALSTEDMLWDQASATTHFRLFKLDNDAIVIAEGGRERSDPLRNGYTVPYVPLIGPNPYDPFAPTVATPGVRTYVASQSFGVGFNDTLKIREWLQFSGGVRFDYFNTKSHVAANLAVTPPTAAADVSRLDKQPTYRAAVVVKPRPEGSVYFDWGTSFNPSAESLSLSANNATAPPEENTNYEVGAKWNYFHDRLNITGSVFRTEKDNAHETDPNNSLNTLTVGTYLVRGAQIGGIGHLPQHMDVIFGYAYLDAILKNSLLNASPFNAVNLALIALNDPRANTAPFFINPNGAPIANVAKNTGNVWITHDLPRRFVGGFGGNYVAARRASSGTMIGLYNTDAPIDVTQVPLVPKSIPGYYVMSLMLRRSIAEHVDFQVNVNNIANKFYIDEPHPNHLVPGEGANAQFGFNYKF
jgi:catecholate siderophore receptor